MLERYPLQVYGRALTLVTKVIPVRSTSNSCHKLLSEAEAQEEDPGAGGQAGDDEILHTH